MMNTSITTKPSNRHRKDKLPPLIRKTNGNSYDDTPKEIDHLCNSINNIRHQPCVTLEKIFESSNSTLGKLYKLFLLIADKKENLVNSKVFDELIIEKSEGLITKINQTNKHSMNFIQFIKQIDLIAKENELSKEYLYGKLLRRTCLINNQNNNALDSSDISSNFSNSLLNEYNNDFSRLHHYFLSHTKANSSCQMNCSTFIQCISEDAKLNQIDIRLQLNGLFYQVQSSLVDQGVYMPVSTTIDFDGFLLCLQHIARTFNFNLRLLIKNLINTEKIQK